MDYIITHGRLKEKLARTFFKQVVAAIEYCHSMRVIHRDIKAENLLLDRQMRIKLIDFGLSNQYAPGELLKTFCGSPTYTAPELIRRQEYQGPEVDIWALGVLLYALVCGSLPFDGNSFQELFTKILSANYFIPDYVSVECRNLISRMLVINPAERITLDMVKEHPWMKLSGDSLSKKPKITYHIPESEQEFDEKLLDECERLGFSREEVIVSVLNSMYNNSSAMYLLLLSKKNTQKEEQVNSQRELSKIKVNEAHGKKSQYKTNSMRHHTRKLDEPGSHGDSDVGPKIVVSPSKNLKTKSKHRRHHTLGSPEDFDSMKKGHRDTKVEKTPEKVIKSPISKHEKSLVILEHDAEIRPIKNSPNKTKILDAQTGTKSSHRRHRSVDLHEESYPRVLPIVRKSERRKSIGKKCDSPQKDLLMCEEINVLDEELDENDLVRPRKNSFLNSIKSKIHHIFVKDPREARFSISTYSSSDQPPSVIMGHIQKVLGDMEIDYELKSPHLLKAEGCGLIFEVEICIVEGLNVYGVKIRRISGDRWEYARIGKKFLRKLDLRTLNQSNADFSS